MNSHPTVLLIDDNPAVAEIVRSVLVRNAYNVEILTSPVRVREFLAQHDVDLIVSDVMMPGMDGFALGKQIRTDPATAGIPIIYLTALASTEDQFEGFLSGGDAYMTKPFRARDLLYTIDRVLNRRDAAQPIRSRSGGNARAMAVVGADLRGVVQQAAAAAGCTIEVAASLADGLRRLDREHFHMLLADTESEPGAVKQVRDFLGHFALATPVLFLYRNQPPAVAANDTQYHALRVPVTAAVLGERVRQAIQDFGGIV